MSAVTTSAVTRLQLSVLHRPTAVHYCFSGDFLRSMKRVTVNSSCFVCSCCSRSFCAWTFWSTTKQWAKTIGVSCWPEALDSATLAANRRRGFRLSRGTNCAVSTVCPRLRTSARRSPSTENSGKRSTTAWSVKFLACLMCLCAVMLSGWRHCEHRGEHWACSSQGLGSWWPSGAQIPLGSSRRVSTRHVTYSPCILA